MTTRRDFLKIMGVGVITAGTVGVTSAFVMQNFPDIFHYAKRKLSLLFGDSLNSEEEFNIPNTATNDSLRPIVKPVISNERDSLEEKIAELFMVVRSNLTNGQYTPGSVLLTKRETRDANLGGEYSSYSPVRTQSKIEEILNLSFQRKKRILIFDEGEGGYVMRIGTLPAAEDIGNYYETGQIGPTIKDRVKKSNSRKFRATQVSNLFEEYAKELVDRGVDAVLGPSLDVVNANFDDNLIKKGGRNFSTKHIITREITKLYCRSMNKYCVKTVGKHYLSAGLTEDGDIHDNTQEISKKIKPRIWALETYRQMKDLLGGVMITHIGNPSDLDRPFSVSQRAYNSLTKSKYPKKVENPVFENNRQAKINRYSGINFKGLVIVDDLSMKGLIDYVANEPLTQRGEALIQGCKTLEAKAAVLSLVQGAHHFIARNCDIDKAVEGIAYAYRIDQDFAKKVDLAIDKYQKFVRC